MSTRSAEENKILLYTSPEGKKKVEVVFQDENCWLTQKAMAELFGVQRPAITKHLKNIIDSGELKEDSVSSILEHTADDGKIYATRYYNLDSIIAVGYRVNSYQATQFRIWATQTLSSSSRALFSTMSASSRGNSSAEIILMSCWSAFARSAPVRGGGRY